MFLGSKWCSVNQYVPVLFVVPLVKAVQEQQEMINSQQELINNLLQRIEALEKE